MCAPCEMPTPSEDQKRDREMKITCLPWRGWVSHGTVPRLFVLVTSASKPSDLIAQLEAGSWLGEIVVCMHATLYCGTHTVAIVPILYGSSGWLLIAVDVLEGASRASETLLRGKKTRHVLTYRAWWIVGPVCACASMALSKPARFPG